MTKTISEKDAESLGYRALTTGYNLPHEQWMLENVLSDMRRGNIDAVTVETESGTEVWRRAPSAK